MEKSAKKMRRIAIPAILSISIFMVVVLKFILVNKMEFVPMYGPEHTFISWILLLPLTIIGFILSVWVIFKYRHFAVQKNSWVNILLALPMILYWAVLILLYFGIL